VLKSFEQSRAESGHIRDIPASGIRIAGTADSVCRTAKIGWRDMMRPRISVSRVNQ
jgi:hypothetical protein